MTSKKMPRKYTSTLKTKIAKENVTFNFRPTKQMKHEVSQQTFVGLEDVLKTS